MKQICFTSVILNWTANQSAKYAYYKGKKNTAKFL